MWKRYLSGSLLGAVGLFVGGMVFWTVLPLSFSVMHAVPKPKAVVKTLQTHLPKSGVYLYPMPSEREGKDAERLFLARHKAGPLVMMFYRKEGLDPMQPSVFVLGILQQLVSALLVGLLLWMALPRLTSFEKRYGFVVLLGIFASVWVDLSAPIWFHQPWDYHLFNALSRVGSWMLAAIPLAWLLRPSPPSSPSALSSNASL